MDLREELPSDGEPVRDIHLRAFGDHGLVVADLVGFAPGGGQGFRKPSLRIPDRAFQAIKLPEYEPWNTGTLVYAEPFWRHDAVGLRDPGA
jgi:hypothetical protein